MDRNLNGKLNINEWSLLDRQDTCKLIFFQSCDRNRDRSLTITELCNCFSDAQKKCTYIRNPDNSIFKKAYIERVQKTLRETNQINIPENVHRNSIELSSKNYTPLCDFDGHFLVTQCDSEIRCWCVDMYGLPKANSLSFLNNEPIQC